MLKLVTTGWKGIPTDGEGEISPFEISRASCLENEPFSFQLAVRAETPREWLTLSVKTELPAEVFRVDFVPVRSDCVKAGEAGYLENPTGLYPDILSPRPKEPTVVRRDNAWGLDMYFEEGVENVLIASNRATQSVLVTLNPESEPLTPGTYRVVCEVYTLENYSLFGRAELFLTVIDAALPPLKQYYTNWFHVDALCDFYRVEPYSEEFYRLFESFLKNAVKHRMNTLLIPAFTPALDTPIGCKRRNVGLVDIRKTGDEYLFDFGRLARFLRTADACGIRYFEHCHLFSQWGAKNAPAVYDTDGRLLFGWQTDAAGEEYRTFLRAYLTSLLEFSREAGYEDSRWVFHLSDEPVAKDLSRYESARRTVADLLEGFEIADALSDMAFYRRGLVGTPVACIDRAEEFFAECSRFWLYYTGTPELPNCTNRLISNTPARTRVLGVQMYRYRAAGFLHWGYNYYYDRLSSGFFDPRLDPCGYKLIPGCSYLAYPTRDGAAPSLREKYMAETFDDLRALLLSETLVGRERTLVLCEEVIGQIDCHTVPSGNAMYTLREHINRKIGDAIARKKNAP